MTYSSRSHLSRLTRTHGLPRRTAQRLTSDADQLVKRFGAGRITREQAIATAFAQAAAAAGGRS